MKDDQWRAEPREDLNKGREKAVTARIQTPSAKYPVFANLFDR